MSYLLALIPQVDSILSHIIIHHTDACAWKHIMELIVEECSPHLCYLFELIAVLFILGLFNQ